MNSFLASCYYFHMDENQVSRIAQVGIKRAFPNLMVFESILHLLTEYAN